MATHANLHVHTTGLEAAALFPSSIRDKTIIVTGVARTGIGGTTALALASQAPGLLILSGRDITKVQGVIDDIKEKYPDVKTRFLQMDLSSQESVRKAAAEVTAWTDVDRVDILINNAGVMALPERVLSVDGIEMQFATNHVGHFLFTNLIRSKLIAAAEKSGRKPGAVRVVNVSSTGHRFSPIRFSDVNFERAKETIPEPERPDHATLEGFSMGWKDDGSTYHQFVSYGQSKTANVLFSLQLQKLLGEKYGIASFGLHPGSIDTALQRHADPEWVSKIRERIQKESLVQMKSIEAGSSTTIVAACDPGLKSTRENLYLSDCQVQTPNYWASDEGAAERLWELSEKLVGEKFEW